MKGGWRCITNCHQYCLHLNYFLPITEDLEISKIIMISPPMWIEPHKFSRNDDIYSSTKIIGKLCSIFFIQVPCPSHCLLYCWKSIFAKLAKPIPSMSAYVVTNKEWKIVKPQKGVAHQHPCKRKGASIWCPK